MECIVFRYRPKWSPKIEVVLRQHDLSGTDYTTIEYLHAPEVFTKYPDGYFLYSDEGPKYEEDTKGLV